MEKPRLSTAGHVPHIRAQSGHSSIGDDSRPRGHFLGLSPGLDLSSTHADDPLLLDMGPSGGLDEVSGGGWSSQVAPGAGMCLLQARGLPYLSLFAPCFPFSYSPPP